MGLTDDIMRESDLSALWATGDDAFVGEMLDRLDALDGWAGDTLAPEAPAYTVVAADLDEDRIGAILAELDAAPFAARPATILDHDVASGGAVDQDFPLVLPLIGDVFDDRLVLPGVMDDDFLFKGSDEPLVRPAELDEGVYRMNPHQHVFQPTVMIMNDEGLYVPEHGHAWFSQDDWLF